MAESLPSVPGNELELRVHDAVLAISTERGITEEAGRCQSPTDKASVNEALHEQFLQLLAENERLREENARLKENQTNQVDYEQLVAGKDSEIKTLREENSAQQARLQERQIVQLHYKQVLNQVEKDRDHLRKDLDRIKKEKELALTLVELNSLQSARLEQKLHNAEHKMKVLYKAESYGEDDARIIDLSLFNLYV